MSADFTKLPCDEMYALRKDKVTIMHFVDKVIFLFKVATL